MRIETYDIYGLTGLTPPEVTPANPEARRFTAYIPELVPEAGLQRRRPAVLILPGGAYAWCSQREAEPVALRFAAEGWCAFVLNYSCAPCAFPTALREAAAAMVHIRQNAGRYGVDPSMVAAMGFSAGGHLCGTLGTMYDCTELSDIASPELIRPDALGLCYPVTLAGGRTHAESIKNISGGDPALAQRLSLDKLIRPDMMPTFIWHTRDDGAVPCCGSLRVAAALEELGVPFALHIYAHGQHGLSTADELVFRSTAVPETSADVAGWCALLIAFLEEQGLRLHDREDMA